MARKAKKARRLTITVPEENFLILEKIANEEDRSLSWMVGQAIDQYVRGRDSKELGGKSAGPTKQENGHAQ